jgi:hypothetical protein
LLDKTRQRGNKKSNSGVLFGDFHQFISKNYEKIAIGVDNPLFGMILFIVKIR